MGFLAREKKSALLGAYSRTMPRALQWSEEGERFLMSEVFLWRGTDLGRLRERFDESGKLRPGVSFFTFSSLPSSLELTNTKSL